MPPLQVLAAGSLRDVWPAIISAFQHHYPAGIVTQFGPAGLLRQRIERGEQCDLFVSASMMHPLALKRAGRAGTGCRSMLPQSVVPERFSPHPSRPLARTAGQPGAAHCNLNAGMRSVR
ncbi:substrate-binding domain-containing protein [Erwinia persicina]|uniref:substrate-binding domain-containing protein n=1 Tax=Erwinia persicina TaxID=55211 RepID=UPI00237B59A5|nr:substrate-binding domain-containing protein [Erwinia persicina]